jgi:hypothetical protein
MVTASPTRTAAILAGTLWFALLLPEGASLVGSSVSAALANLIVSVADLAKAQPLLALADDLAPPSPDAIVTTPPPAPFAENVPPPFARLRLGPRSLGLGWRAICLEARNVHCPTHRRRDLHSRVLAKILRRMGLGGRALELGNIGRGRLG